MIGDLSGFESGLIDLAGRFQQIPAPLHILGHAAQQFLEVVALKGPLAHHAGDELVVETVGRQAGVRFQRFNQDGPPFLAEGGRVFIADLYATFGTSGADGGDVRFGTGLPTTTKWLDEILKPWISGSDHTHFTGQ